MYTTGCADESAWRYDVSQVVPPDGADRTRAVYCAGRNPPRSKRLAVAGWTRLLMKLRACAWWSLRLGTIHPRYPLCGITAPPFRRGKANTPVERRVWR